MTRRRKIFIGLIGCVITVLFLLFAIVLIGPKVVDTQMVKARVRSELEKASGIEIGYEHLILLSI